MLSASVWHSVGIQRVVRGAAATLVQRSEQGLSESLLLQSESFSSKSSVQSIHDRQLADHRIRHAARQQAHIQRSAKARAGALAHSFPLLWRRSSAESVGGSAV